MPSQQILDVASKGGWASVGRFPLTIDGYFLTEDPATIYANGKQARVPLLVGWNSEEWAGTFSLVPINRHWKTTRRFWQSCTRHGLMKR